MRSDDYFDGLQVAYKLVYQLQEAEPALIRKRAFAMALAKIDEAINTASEPDKPRIIIP